MKVNITITSEELEKIIARLESIEASTKEEETSIGLMLTIGYIKFLTGL